MRCRRQRLVHGAGRHLGARSLRQADRAHQDRRAPSHESRVRRRRLEIPLHHDDWICRTHAHQHRRRAVALKTQTVENKMAWNFELVAGPFKGRTGGLAWDGKGMLFSAVAEERILRYDPSSGETTVFRRWTGRTYGIAVAKDG